MDVLERLAIAVALASTGAAVYWAWNHVRLWRLRRAVPVAVPGLEALVPGKPAILYFTTPECAVCRTAQRPALARLAADMGQGVQVLEVDAQAQPTIADYWGVLSVPTTFVLDSRGHPRRVNNGLVSTARLTQQIELVERDGAGGRVSGLTLPGAARIRDAEPELPYSGGD